MLYFLKEYLAVSYTLALIFPFILSKFTLALIVVFFFTFLALALRLIVCTFILVK